MQNVSQYPQVHADTEMTAEINVGTDRGNANTTTAQAWVDVLTSVRSQSTGGPQVQWCCLMTG